MCLSVNRSFAFIVADAYAYMDDALIMRLETLVETHLRDHQGADMEGSDA